MSNAIDVLVFGLQGLAPERRLFRHGIALHARRPSGIKANAPPAALRHGRRVMPWESSTPILGAFEGDGEAINFEAGPMHDWRSPGAGVDINDEHSEAARDKLANDLILDIDEEAGFAALMDDSDSNRGSVGQHIVTLTYIVVLLVGLMYVASYFQSGGLKQIVPTGDGPTFGFLGGFIAWRQWLDRWVVWKLKRKIWWRTSGRQRAVRLGTGLLRWAVARGTGVPKAVGRFFLPSLPRSWVAYLLQAARYEPRIAVALAALGLAYVAVSVMALWMSIVEQRLGPISIAAFVLFGLFLTTGLSAFIVTPLVWSRLWMKRVDITPTGPVESYVNPAERGSYGPAYLKGRTLVVVPYAQWGEETVKWATCLGHTRGEMPMPARRRHRVVSDVDVANSGDQRDLKGRSHVPTLTWEKPVQYLALFGIISVALFMGLAVISERGA